MTQRDALLVIVGVLAAAVVGLVLFVAILVRQGPPGRPDVAIGRGPQPTARPIPEIERRLPNEFRFLAPIIPLQRSVGEVGRDAAGLLLVLLLTGGTLVLAREHVVRIHASSAGDWTAQARIFGLGIGVLVTIASGTLLAIVVLLRTLAGLAPPNFVFGLQTLFSVFALVLLVVGVAALLGFAAASWRLGVWFLGLPAWRRITERVPVIVAALVAAGLLYLAAQLPVVGPLVAALVLAYSLGAFVRARLIRSEAHPST